MPTEYYEKCDFQKHFNTLNLPILACTSLTSIRVLNQKMYSDDDGIDDFANISVVFCE